jgi:hypothetical protein
MMEEGSVAEAGLAGNDGVVGVALFLGGDTTPNRAVVQLAGAIRMQAKLLQDEFRRGGALQELLLRYTQALSPRSPRLPPATGSIQWNNASAAGY